MANNKVILTDGQFIKSINPFTDNTPGVWTSNETSKEAKSARLVPSVYAGVGARMQAMADLPFTIYSVKGDKELDNSDNYKNAVGFLPYPSRIFSLAEGALTVAGKAYWFKGVGARTGAMKELKYWIPSSVTLDSDKAKKGIIEFKRQGADKPFPAEQVLYIWGVDPDIELGPPTVWPLESALTAAQANGAITSWVADYMKRGAVKAMLLMVDGMPPAGEVDKMETWFNRLMSGTKSLVWKVFNAAGVKPVIVGDGLDSVKDLSVSKDLRYEIHQALGTRHLLEDENFATAEARERQFYTITMLPDARTIQYAFNEQILHAMGCHLEFEPERLEIFQVNEAEQTKSFGDLFGVFKEVLPVEVAFQLASEKLDYEFTDEQKALIDKGISEKKKENEKLAAEMAKQTEQAPPQNNQPVPPKQNPATVRKLVELDKWQDKVTKAGKMVTWHAVDLTPEMVDSIKSGTVTFGEARTQLKEYKSNPLDSFGTMAGMAPSMNQGVDSIKELAAAINKAAEVVSG